MSLVKFTVAYVETKAIANKGTIDNQIMPQLGQIGTNKVDVAANKVAIANTDTYVHDTRRMITAELLRQYENAPAAIALMIKNDNYIKNPAAQHISRYLKDQAGLDMPNNVTADLRAKNLEYPGWSRDSGDLITYNFTAAIAGKLTIGQLGGSDGANMEYRVNGGSWVKVGNINSDHVKNVSIGYTGNAGAQVSVRVNKDFGGIAFAIPTPAYWLSRTGTRGGGIDNGLLKLSHGLFRARIDLEACGYWFAATSKVSNGEYAVNKSYRIGKISKDATWGYDVGQIVSEVTNAWVDPGHKVSLKITSKYKDVSYLFATTDPDSFRQAEVY